MAPNQFLVAFSFAGEERDLVRQVAEATRECLGEGTVFFDEWYEHEIAGFSADDFLQELYRKRSTLVIPCVSKAYGGKPWTLLELEAVKALKMELLSSADPRSRQRILPLRVGDGDIPGIYENAIILDIRERPPGKTAALIIARLRQIDPEAVPPASGIYEPGEITVVPKGLRSFGSEDKNFFLDLLPGPRRHGLPESVWFWKSRIEAIDPDPSFKVGLIYGPSGCGKSSLVKAGLLPRLADHVIAVYVEATAEETESRILNDLQKHMPELPTQLGFVETFKVLRKGYGPKVVLIVDQFEQWLHEHRAEKEPDLIHACRHCDGEHLQVILMVRDGFYMAIHRFMSVLDISISEDHNFAAVDLFTSDHAIYVLKRFGHAYHRFSADEPSISADQKAFLSRVSTELAEQGRVVAVRLALFAEMVKNEPWTAEMLKQKGSVDEIGVQFLEETFKSTRANPSHRRHAEAAQNVLKSLLPDPGADIKGNMRSHSELFEASGYNSPHGFGDFEELLHILDRKTRLITPTDPEGGNENGKSVDPDKGQGRFYQLTHDYLVPSLREWLTRELRKTRRGRAALLLAEREAIWNVKRERRHLPSFSEWIRILFLTSRSAWTGARGEMMSWASRFHLTVLSGLAGLIILACIIGWQINGRVKTQALIEGLTTAREKEIPGLNKKLEKYRRWAEPRLLQFADDQFNPTGDQKYFRGSRSTRIAWYLAVGTAASSGRYNLIFPLFKNLVDEKGIKALQRLAAEKPQGEGPREERLALGKSRADAAITLFRLGKRAEAFPALHVQEDPESLTQFVHRCKERMIQPSDLITSLPLIEAERRNKSGGERRQEDRVLYGLLLALGSFDFDKLDLPKEEKLKVVNQLQEWHQEDPSSAIHSVTGWLLREWQQRVPEQPVDYSPDREWFTLKIEIAENEFSFFTFIVFPAGDYMIGSPEGELSRNENEVRHSVSVSSAFAVLDREITMGELMAYDQALGDVVEQFKVTVDQAAVGPAWCDAIGFCQWLSKKVPMEKEDDPYDGQVCDSLSSISVQLDRNGFRLPTEAEWEIAARAGMRTSFSFGDDAKLLEKYGYYQENSDQHVQVTRRLRPNARGLFDVHGNVYEWCYDWVWSL